MSRLNVLVVGASVAGPTAAYWLAKAGANVTVIERFPELRVGGQNIDIRTAGVTVMRRMPGMEGAVRAKPADIEGLSFVRENGRPYGTIRATGNPDQQSIVSEYEIFRGDLSKIIFDMTKDNDKIKYVFGEQVVSIQQNERDDGPVTVEFANGLPTSAYDLVVACDGATSRTRAIGLGCGIRDHIKPTNCWAAYCSIKSDFLEGSKIGQGYSAVGGRFIAVGPDPAGGNRVAMMRFSPKGNYDATRPFREALKQGDDALKQFVAQNYKDAGWKTNEILKHAMLSEDFYGSEVLQVKLPNLYKGRFVLVGDAGYAPGLTGGGTTLALAGAYLLAGELCKNKIDLAAGLQGYEEQMKPIIKEMQGDPSFVHTVMAPQTGWGIWLRNHIFMFVAWSGIVNIVQRFFGGALGSTDAYKLPEYEWVA